MRAQEDATEQESFEVQPGVEEMATLRLADALGTLHASDPEGCEMPRVESCLWQVQCSAVLAGVQSDFDSSLAGAMIIGSRHKREFASGDPDDGTTRAWRQACCGCSSHAASTQASATKLARTWPQRLQSALDQQRTAGLR